MKEGTKSFLIGSHSPIAHGICVLIAWRLEYKTWPKWWQTICIFLHDIGICGRQYLSDDNAKKGHWENGALWSSMIVWKISKNRKLANESYDLVAGHAPNESGFPKSMLWRPDKRSWLIAPISFLWWNYWIEWAHRDIEIAKPPLWRKLVADNLKSDNPLGSHELYIKNRGLK